jgi:hypothetical protein
MGEFFVEGGWGCNLKSSLELGACWGLGEWGARSAREWAFGQGGVDLPRGARGSAPEAGAVPGTWGADAPE